MPVVINEFEVVPDAAPPTQGNTRAETDTAKPKEPLDLEKILRQRAERAQRVRAH